MLANTIAPTSIALLCRTAETTPSVTPSSDENAVAKTVSSIVIGNRSATMSEISRESLIEVPSTSPGEGLGIPNELNWNAVIQPETLPNAKHFSGVAFSPSMM